MRSNQRGLVLFVALIFLLIITILGVALLSNSAMDAKMAGAASDRTEALQAANGVLDDVLMNADTNRAFLSDASSYSSGLTIDTSLKDEDGNARQATVHFDGESSCPRSEKGTGTDTFVCRHFHDSADVAFGRRNLAKVETTNGISQPLIAPTGS
ncbi:PilX N-terminal domain-containing pilus assembly protein [Gallaecimonas kandeliae]|uniref:PilX N-terminal domain-containing pilus assembly protein n=1 Tax=Gallaecimonas kandeliae TaxID=3029055 RepID=UPI002648E2BA|nr:PilX N-terminal domain-containing pilus assembly protein [Gallaecimonas kandeliae]WKE64957.1 PilX N-terminal domain-containing pilus assembly protein [Gallaecimonas kandeliae]